MTRPPAHAIHDLNNGIRNRLLVSGLLTVIVGFVATALMIAIVANSIATLNERSTTLHQIEAADEDLMVAMQGMETFAFDLALTGRDQALEELDVAQDTEHEAYAELERLALTIPSSLRWSPRSATWPLSGGHAGWIHS